MQNQRNSISAIFSSLDLPTVIIYLLLVAWGVMSIYAASYDYDNASIFAFGESSGKQVRWVALSLVLALVLLLIDARMYETYAYPIYVAIIILLIITPFVSHDIKGSRSWITFGPMSLQPAEFAKFATALALAKLFSGYNFLLNARPANYLRALTIILLPVVLILLQKETGSALTFLALFFVLYREGMTGLILFAAIFSIVIFVVAVKYAETQVWGMDSGQLAVLLMVMLTVVIMVAIYDKRRIYVARNVLGWFTLVVLVCTILAAGVGMDIPGMAIMISSIAIAIAYITFEALKTHVYKLLIPVATATFAIIFLFSVDIAFNQLQPHQQQRIKVVLGIEEDLRGSGYNVNQSKIAIGSGGFTGKGFLSGTQTKLKYVPEQHTDFIFCTIGEEQGFVGSVILLALFLALILRIITIAERQPTIFGRVYAYCVASYFILHFCINIGMVIGLCPVIGIPLPFISYGGSSLWGFTILLFIMLKIDANRKNVLSY